MDELSQATSSLHVFRIHFNFRDQLQTASLTITQKADHDEYYIMPDDEGLAKEFGGQTLNFYFNQPDPMLSDRLENDFDKSIKTGVNEFLDSKHS